MGVSTCSGSSHLILSTGSVPFLELFCAPQWCAGAGYEIYFKHSGCAQHTHTVGFTFINLRVCVTLFFVLKRWFLLSGHSIGFQLKISERCFRNAEQICIFLINPMFLDNIKSASYVLCTWMSNNVAMASSQSGMSLLPGVLAKRQHTEW